MIIVPRSRRPAQPELTIRELHHQYLAKLARRACATPGARSLYERTFVIVGID